MISALPNRFKYRQKSQFTVFLFFFFSLQFQIVSNTVKMHHFKIFSAVSNRFKCRQNAPFTVPVFKICACFFLWSYKSFQIVYEYTLHLVFDLSLKFQIAFQIASECAILPSMVSTCSGGADSHPHAPPTQNPGTPLQHCSIKHFGYTDEG